MRRWLIVMLCCGCAASGPALESPAQRATEVERSPPGRGGPALSRAAVLRTVDQGLGSFLQRVEVEPSVSDGRFQGFRIIALMPDSYWHRVDLEPGDVVTHVNGRSIEQPDEAWEVFRELAHAPQLRVDLLRDGERRQLLLPIVGEPPPRADDEPEPRPEKRAADAASR